MFIRAELNSCSPNTELYIALKQKLWKREKNITSAFCDDTKKKEGALKVLLHTK